MGTPCATRGHSGRRREAHRTPWSPAGPGKRLVIDYTIKTHVLGCEPHVKPQVWFHALDAASKLGVMQGPSGCRATLTDPCSQVESTHTLHQASRRCAALHDSLCIRGPRGRSARWVRRQADSRKGGADTGDMPTSKATNVTRATELRMSSGPGSNVRRAAPWR